MTKREHAIAAGAEVITFQHFVIDNPDLGVDYIVDYYKFELSNVEIPEVRDHLIQKGHDARRYPHRVPKK